MSFCYRLSFLLLYAMFIIGCNQGGKSEGSEVETSKTEAPVALVKVDKNKVVGNWVRTDAPYQLNISALTDGGTMTSAYFNPKEIHVGKSYWTDVNGVITLYVELRDVNYPGSNYTLSYVPGQDMLTGKYFQAVEGSTYDISFARAK